MRLPRHGGSCRSYGALLSADRNIKAKINKHGIWLENFNTIRAIFFQPHCGKKITRNMYNWI
ncbi:hypothetical protein ACLB1R_15415 [Escherichia coli]